MTEFYYERSKLSGELIKTEQMAKWEDVDMVLEMNGIG